MNQDLEAVLRNAHLRATAPRKSVFKALKNAPTPLTVAELIKLLPTTDKVSIYRTVDTFLQLGIITAVPQGWKPRYELASPFKPHHHHLYCTSCSQLIDIHASEIEDAIIAVAKDHNFLIQSHTFEVSGLCQACRATRQVA